MSIFFQNLLNSLFAGNDPEALKKRALRNISKNLLKTKYRFYKPGTHEADPSLAKFFYEIYKVISPAQLMFQSIIPAKLKSLVIGMSLSEEQKQLIDGIDENFIKEKAAADGVQKTSQFVEESVSKISDSFDSTFVAKIDSLYSKILCLRNFCLYDFYFLLKKFDGRITEHNFLTQPRFTPINGSYISEDIKEFIDIAWCIPTDQDWDDVFKLLRQAKGIEPITLAVWKKILVRIRNLKERKILEMLVQLVTEDPNYRAEAKSSNQAIAEDYIANIRNQAKKTVSELKAAQTAEKVGSLLDQVFETRNIEKLNYYTEVRSSIFEAKSLGSFKYTEPLAYLRQFILDYAKKYIRELSDILLVRAAWSNQQIAKPMSDAYNYLMEVSTKIAVLDSRISETSDLGSKIKTLMPRAERDKEARNIIGMTIDDINDEAAKIILNSTRHLVTYDKNLKMLLEDSVKKHPELIMNWKEINHFAGENLKNMAIEVYKKIYLFVSLLQNFPVEIVRQD